MTTYTVQLDPFIRDFSSFIVSIAKMCYTLHLKIATSMAAKRRENFTQNIVKIASPLDMPCQVQAMWIEHRSQSKPVFVLKTLKCIEIYLLTAHARPSLALVRRSVQLPEYELNFRLLLPI